ncbi:securin-like [Hyla sarda]|uniref:securin-like n=1 Tax=Hyla sarda TaxID=327740 RepID=UPI0024C3F3C8|nr:securin-like [Hyla sarda]
MDTLMQFGKENGEHVFHPSKRNQGSFIQPSKGLGMKKSSGLNASKVQPLRKVLGNVNQHVPDRYSSTKMKQKKQVHPKNKTYPDIETFIPYNPLDFETFDVPEEHRLGNHCLAGIKLFISSADAKHFEALTSPILSPMKTDPISYDANETLIPVFEDFIIDLPFV